MTDDTPQYAFFDSINTEGDVPQQYLPMFISDHDEWGLNVAIYNLGFLMGWDDRNEKDDSESG